MLSSPCSNRELRIVCSAFLRRGKTTEKAVNRTRAPIGVQEVSVKGHFHPTRETPRPGILPVASGVLGYNLLYT